jgi:hypothetical protein
MHTGCESGGVGFALDLGLQYLPGSLFAATHQLALIPHFEGILG